MMNYEQVNKKLPPGTKFWVGDTTNGGQYYDDQGWYAGPVYR